MFLMIALFHCSVYGTIFLHWRIYKIGKAVKFQGWIHTKYRKQVKELRAIDNETGNFI